MLFALLAGFIGACLSPLFFRIFKRFTPVLLALVPAGIFVYLLGLLEIIVPDVSYTENFDWVPQLGIELNFLIDGLSLFFGLLISGFGTFIFLYAGAYLKGDAHIDRFFIYILVFMGSMLGLVFSGNIISLFVFWELTSLSSYMLIGYKNKYQSSRESALQAMLVTVTGGLALLAGFILIGFATGSYELVDLLNSELNFQNHSMYLPALLLVLLGAFTKSAQFPFHFWLPNAMAAPTPVSAYLHSATMVKAGIYLLARLTPLLGYTLEWQLILSIGGGITMVLGAWLSFQHSDLKKILAYTTISALGILVMMLGIGTTEAIQGAIIFILAHALYKGTLFLVAGNVDHATGTREANALSGLRKAMPFTAIAAILACLSMAGMMPFLGFIGKEIVYQATLESTIFNIYLLVATISASVLFVAIAIVIAYKVFFGHQSPTPQKPHEVSFGMALAPLMFSGLGLLFGVFAQGLVQPLLQSSWNTVLQRQETLELTLWHGFNVVLGLSVLTVLLGILFYKMRTPITQWASKYYFLGNFGPLKGYEAGLSSLLKLATFQTRVLQNGYLRNYVSTIFVFFIFLICLTFMVKSSEFEFLINWEAVLNTRFYELIIVSLTAFGVVYLFITQSRLTGLAALGIVGYGIALIFIFFGAPDVAMTQFLIETLTVVLFVLAIHKLPNYRSYSEKRRKAKYLFVSLVFGGLMTFIVLLITQVPLVSQLKAFYAESSVPLAHGRNIVNVILVDFRGIDTLGEIVVLGIAAIGIYSLLKLRLEK
jgi:multicomponent Na+:H+ antiporter subunit A